MRSVYAFVLCLFIGVSVSASNLSGYLEAKGSDTMVNLMQSWAEVFMEENPMVMMAVTGGGSGTGIAALINGTTHLAAASRAIRDQERAQAAAQGRTVVDNLVAWDALAVVVHPQNPVKQLTMDQIAGIYSGKISNWNQVGGPNAPIVVLSRDTSSGTYVFFKEEVVMADYRPDALLMPSTSAIVGEVERNVRAIGYIGLGYLNEKVAPVAVGMSGQFVHPSLETAKAGLYPISRPLFIYTTTGASALAKAYLKFAFSEAGQKIVQDIGYIPVN